MIEVSPRDSFGTHGNLNISYLGSVSATTTSCVAFLSIRFKSSVPATSLCPLQSTAMWSNDSSNYRGNSRLRWRPPSQPSAIRVWHTSLAHKRLHLEYHKGPLKYIVVADYVSLKWFTSLFVCARFGVIRRTWLYRRGDPLRVMR